MTSLPWLSQVQFREPWLLLAAVLAIPAFLLSHRSAGRILFSSLELIPRQRKTWRTRLSWLPDALIGLAVVATAIALAGPRKGNKSATVKREGIAMMMVVDTSGSMQALDLSTDKEERTRLDAVKLVFQDFVRGGAGLEGRPNDAIGIVTFAGYADTMCPLTIDHDNLLTIARSLAIVTDRNEDGTALGDGLALAVERLRDAKAKSRVAILLTDGVNNAGIDSPVAAAEVAKKIGVKVYTIGAGTTGTAQVRVPDPFTGQSVLRAMPVEIDEATLKDIAARTGGRYFRATDAEALIEVYKEIDALERSEIEEQKFVDFRHYFGFFVGAALGLLALAWLLGATVFRRYP